MQRNYGITIEDSVENNLRKKNYTNEPKKKIYILAKLSQRERGSKSHPTVCKASVLEK